MIKCKQCGNKFKKVKHVTCDVPDCKIKYPGKSEVLSFSDFKKTNTPEVEILEDVQSPDFQKVTIDDQNWADFVQKYGY